MLTIQICKMSSEHGDNNESVEGQEEHSVMSLENVVMLAVVGGTVSLIGYGFYQLGSYFSKKKDESNASLIKETVVEVANRKKNFKEEINKLRERFPEYSTLLENTEIPDLIEEKKTEKEYLDDKKKAEESYCS